MAKIVDSTQLDLMFAQLRKNVSNTAPVMRSLAGDMLDSVEENFEKEGRLPKWKKLRQSTIIGRATYGRKGQKLKRATTKRRLKKTFGTKGFAGKILQHTGQLASSIRAKSNINEAIVGTNKVYAATQQFGARKGQYGKDKKGRSIPWGKIPARPFLKFTPRDVKGFSQTILKYLISE